MSITTVEEIDTKNIQNIKFFNFYSEKNKNKIIQFPIDINYINKLCTEGILKDAIIFKYLFGLEIPSNSFKIDKDYSYDFSKYDITFEEWTIFIKFIKYKILSDNNIDELILISNKFGGIPYIDKYLQNKKDKVQLIPAKYNPQFPKEDYLKLYIWKTSLDKDILKFQNENINYSACGFSKITAITIIHYFRKKKNNNTTDHNNISDLAKEGDIFYDDMYDFRRDILE